MRAGIRPNVKELILPPQYLLTKSISRSPASQSFAINIHRNRETSYKNMGNPHDNENLERTPVLQPISNDVVQS